ncbi:MAG: leucyl aminopeptidase [Planctomycetota bacterium]|nr:MAG: leucyl aminopeptidase [Planctomycetota bacterium]
MNLGVFEGKWSKEYTALFFVFRDLVAPKVKGVGDAKAVQQALDLAKEEGFGGKKEEVIVVNPPSSKLGNRVIFVGLGDKKEAKPTTFREVTGAAMRALRFCPPHLVMVLPSARALGESSTRLAQLATEGVLLGTYRFDRYLNGAGEKKWKNIYLANVPSNQGKKGIERGRIFAEAAIFARDLVNEGASVVTPEYLANIAKQLAEKEKSIEVKIFNEKTLIEQNFGGIYGVGRGSHHPPCFIELKYTPAKAQKTLALVGKGVTFDSGGVNIKPTHSLETMKEDMSGAAAVLGVFSALAKLRPKLKVVGLIPASENMVDGNSYKPGDFLRTYSGKTVEVTNTDAEGRIILADALSYGVRHHKPDVIIDMATLTGSAALALGQNIMALFSTDDSLALALQEASDRSGEKLWRLPLEKDYMEDLKSHFADIKNAPAIRRGGAIHGALFLHYFLESHPRWAHFDIAGVAWSTRDRGYIRRGGTGVTVRTLLEYCMDENLWKTS